MTIWANIWAPIWGPIWAEAPTPPVNNAVIPQTPHFIEYVLRNN